MAKLPEDYEKYASPFSTAFGGTAASTELDAIRQYASPFSTAFGGSAPTTEMDLAREYASPFSTAFGGTAPTVAADLPPTPEVKTNTEQTGNTGNQNTSVPAMNDRSQEPRPAQKGYRWRWVSMSKTNNPYGGEWREEWAGGVQDGDGNNGKGGNGDVTLISTETDDYGNVVGFYSDGTSKILIKSGRTTKTTVDEDAYALLEQTFKDYGLPELVPIIQGYMDRNLGANQAALELRKEPVYQARFKGNEIRRATGLNVLSEAEYLALEDSYSQTLRAYGIQNYFGADTKAKQKAMSDIIGNDISATEFKDRIDTVVTRVQNADAAIKTTLRSFYNITDEDIVGYFLNPKDNLPKLQEKVTSAEIGAAAKGQGLGTSVEAAIALAQFGVTKQQAQEGYQTIGAVLPTASKLGDIYKDTYTQDIAEQEVFKGSASAQRKRQKLAALEEAQFGGSSGRLRTGQSRGNQGAF
jgi:hypothetical protein